MPGLCRRVEDTHRIGTVNHAQLFSPEPVFWHVCKPPEYPDPSWPCDNPTGFFINLTVQRTQWMLARVDAAAWQLQFRYRLCLMRDQQMPPLRQDRIDPGPQPITHILARCFAESPDHGVPPWCPGLSCLHTRDMPNQRA